MAQGRRITVGRIDYANAWPLFHGLEDHARGMSYELVSRVPSALNALLQQGKLDVSAISSFSYGRYAEDYVLLPKLSVGSVGRVYSILLFLKQPIEESRPAKIAVTTASETSINLLKIIMSMRYGFEPEYIPAEPDLDRMLETADAALLIGDPAIRASWSNHNLHVLDLGEQWNEWTGLGMTYAVVAARREWVRSAGEDVHALYDAMTAARLANVAHPDLLVDQACRQLGGDENYWRVYFQALRYDFDEKLQRGLGLYFQYAAALGLLKEGVSLSFLEEQFPLKVNE
ncbi:menaquinone biosynthesis protein [Paenibacillus sp. LHD-117]|uniref:menaquinone biosynthetic enzyme MqnA/MqnD family protein n=1 Tax=Paenibacillus sp. LHD-117 TaxID=3071412 RepID=UPI0027E0AE31|nr:menaquinone biosynthesis protein [Paenibacillus sp. LHD-117]MDQ6418233.1 menaquinone biosynthesis protein [Paenibacillus sp. LHD-117]